MEILEFDLIGINNPKLLPVILLDGIPWFPINVHFIVLNYYERGVHHAQSDFLNSLEPFQHKEFLYNGIHPTPAVSLSGLYKLLYTTTSPHLKPRVDILVELLDKRVVPYLVTKKLVEKTVVRVNNVRYTLAG